MNTESLEQELFDKRIKQETRRANLKMLQNSIATADREIMELEIRIDEARRNGVVTVTEHALLRYAERKFGFDAEEAKRIILSPELLSHHEAHGDGNIVINGVTAVVRSGKVVTVY